MMQQGQVADRIQRGLGVAARRLGAMYDAYRPRSGSEPLAPGNRVVTLPAVFDVANGRFGRTPHPGQAIWQGIFDAAYTQSGDYLSGPSGVFFVAAQPPLLPVVCVLTNCTVSLSRPAAPSAPGVNAYGGVSRGTAAEILADWPASLVLAGARGGRDEVGLPGGGGQAGFTMLLPVLPAELTSPRVADLVVDDAGAAYVVLGAEQNAFGWRMILRQASS